MSSFFEVLFQYSSLYIFSLVSFFLSAALTYAVVIWLRKKAYFDQPNARSSHEIPTPRGGGWGVMMTLWFIWAGFAFLLPESRIRNFTMAVVALSFLLGIISWVDDRKPGGLHPIFRLLIQIISVSIPLAMLPSETGFTQGLLPPLVDKVLLGISWVWFINLFNFMDGINGITGVQAVSVALSTAVVSIFVINHATMPFLAITIAGAALGFLVWNFRPKAIVFLGDIGSIGLGYLLGFLLVMLALNGYWYTALVIPLYYWADATLTLLRRLFRGEKIWQAHREHFYQMASSPSGGWSHLNVSLAIAALNVVLGVCAYRLAQAETLFSCDGAIYTGVAVTLTVLLLFIFSRFRD